MALWVISKSEEKGGGRAYDDTQRSIPPVRADQGGTNAMGTLTQEKRITAAKCVARPLS